MEYAYFSSMGRLFFSVLRGGGDEMVREGAKADVHAGGADLILSVDFTWVGYSDEKRRKTTENKEFRCS